MRIYLSFFLLLLLTACYEPVEGCLDTRASNFDLDADESCDDCCTFPEMKIRFNSFWSESGVEVPLKDTFYLDAANQPFRFEQLRFYWSGLQVDLVDGSQLEVLDSVDLTIVMAGDTSVQTFVDNYMLGQITSTTRTSTVGPVFAAGVASGFSGQFGISDPANSAVANTVIAGHPLRPQLGRMNLGAELGYIFAKIEFYQDTIATDTVVRSIDLYGLDLIEPLSFQLLTPTTMVEGAEPVFLMNLDLGALFAGIDVRSTDTTALKQLFVNNLAQTFELTGLSNE